MQAEVNIGTVGHVDHGKTSLTKALTGTWTDTHSEELKRGITIKLGYADASIYECTKCPKPDGYSPNDKCPKCGGPAKLVRKVSFLDAPGHETLMTTAIAASSVIDGAMLVIAANEKCPQPQTLEHRMVLDILGVKNVIVVQNKVDLVPREKAVENQVDIRNFLKGTVAENAPIVPIAANHAVNIDVLMEAIQAYIPTPKRDLDADVRMYVARSFDVNKPGAGIEKLVGGVIGGSIIKGKLSVGDEVELRPGISRGEKGKEAYEPVFATVESLHASEEKLKTAHPGGLIAIGTKLDPAVAKSDGLVGNLMGKPGTLPEIASELELEYTLIARQDMDNPPLRAQEPLVVSIGTSTNVGFVEKMKKNNLSLKLKRPVCVEKGAKAALSRRIGNRWHLAGFGVVK